jgi:small subunit ribosomal protein S20
VANHKSAKKRSRQAVVKTEINKVRKTQARTVIKEIKAAINEKDKAKATELFPKAQSHLYKLAKNGVIKPNQAGRKTSRLASQINSIA